MLQECKKEQKRNNMRNLKIKYLNLTFINN